MDAVALSLHRLIATQAVQRRWRIGKRAQHAAPLSGTHRQILSILLILVIAGAVRIAALGHDARFHGDEALYATFARRISYNGDLLLQDVPLDKPPLGLMLTAVSFSLLSATEFAARIPTLFVSLIQIAVAYSLAKRRFGVDVGLLTALILALSPMDIAFSVTVFHDPPLSLCIWLVALCASRDRWSWAGVAAACAIAIKQSAVQYLPAAILIGLCMVIDARWRFPDYRRRAIRFLVPILIGVTLIALWSLARTAPVDFWTLGVTNPGLLRLIRDDEIGPRLNRWLELLATMIGFSPLLVLLLISPLRALIGKPDRIRLIDLALAIGVLANLIALWLLAFNTYDRYLYPLIVPIAILIARAAFAIRLRIPRMALISLIPILMLPYTVGAIRGQAGVGSDSGAFQNIDRLATAINALPTGSIVYDHWLGWHLGFYIGHYRWPPPVYIWWLESPESFAVEVCKANGDRSDRYFAAPREQAERWLYALETAGGRSTVITVEGRFALYGATCH